VTLTTYKVTFYIPKVSGLKSWHYRVGTYSCQTRRALVKKILQVERELGKGCITVVYQKVDIRPTPAEMVCYHL